MQILVTFRHIDATEPLKEHATKRIIHLKKYLDETAKAHVVLSTEKHNQRADIQISSHGILMRGKEDSSDLYNSIDRAVEKLETQIKRHNTRIKSHKPKTGKSLKVKFDTFENPENNGLPNNIIETKEVEARPMMLDEACMQMDLLGSEILVFLNAKTEHLNILYRKKGQKFGLIEAL
jgi:putative sigma-54 modulation protein